MELLAEKLYPWKTWREKCLMFRKWSFVIALFSISLSIPRKTSRVLEVLFHIKGAPIAVVHQRRSSWSHTHNYKSWKKNHLTLLSWQPQVKKIMPNQRSWRRCSKSEAHFLSVPLNSHLVKRTHRQVTWQFEQLLAFKRLH